MPTLIGMKHVVSSVVSCVGRKRHSTFLVDHFSHSIQQLFVYGKFHNLSSILLAHSFSNDWLRYELLLVILITTFKFYLILHHTVVTWTHCWRAPCPWLPTVVRSILFMFSSKILLLSSIDDVWRSTPLAMFFLIWAFNLLVVSIIILDIIRYTFEYIQIPSIQFHQAFFQIQRPLGQNGVWDYA